MIHQNSYSMKTAICFLFFDLVIGLVCSQAKTNNRNDCKPFTLTVKVNNLDTGKIRIMYNNCNDASAKYVVNLKNGLATFTGFIDSASEALLVVDLSSKHFNLDGPKVIRFILEPKQMTLSYSVNSLGAYNISITGSSSQTKYEAWKKENSLDLTLIDVLRRKNNPSLSIKESDLISLSLDSVQNIMSQKVKTFVSANKDSYVSAYLLKWYFRKMPIDTVKAYYSQLLESAQHNSIGVDLLDKILTLSANDDAFLAKYGTLNLGKQLKSAKGFLDFTLLDANNNQFDLKKFDDRFTFVNLWASWCEPCIKNLPEFEKLKTRYKDKQINFVSISIDTKAADWKKAMVANKLSGINLIDADGILKSFYQIQGVPVYMIIKPDGGVAALNVPKPGSPGLNEIIDGYLSEKLEAN